MCLSYEHNGYPWSHCPTVMTIMSTLYLMFPSPSHPIPSHPTHSHPMPSHSLPFHRILSHPISSLPFPSYLIPSHFVLSHPTPSYSIPLHLIPFHFILFHPILFYLSHFISSSASPLLAQIATIFSLKKLGGMVSFLFLTHLFLPYNWKLILDHFLEKPNQCSQK